MKTFITTLLAFVALSSSSQTVWIVDNRPSAPTGAHIFSNVTDAIAAASSGDIIHLTPSQVSYGNWAINKDSLTFFGVGYNPDKEQPAVVSNGTITLNPGVFGIRLSGLNATTVSLGTTSGGSIGNVIIENGEIDFIDGDHNSFAMVLSNIIIRNCVIGMTYATNTPVIYLDDDGQVSSTSVVIANNIIMGTSSSGATGAIGVTDAIIRNNLFLGNGAGDFAFSILETSTVSNNIFLGRSPQPDAANAIGNSTFNNNISFSTSDDIFPNGSNGNTGSGNLEGTDPLLSGVTIQDDWDFSFNPTPDGGSPALSGGNDGTDIGVTGGTIPYSTTGTPLPIIKVLRLPELIQEGADVDATIEAEGN